MRTEDIALTIVVIGLLTIGQGHGQQQPEVSDFGEFCNETVHCRINAGLICRDALCSCSNGPLNQQYSFQLEWVPAVEECQARLGSACIGTTNNVSTTVRQVHCVGAAALVTQCLQIPGLPPGVGLCKPGTPVPLQMHGQECTELRYCDPAAGLICATDEANTARKICSCGHGEVTRDIPFDLEWNQEKSKCIGKVGSACVGTLQTQVLPGSPKRVECVAASGTATVTCEQVDNLPLGIGTCKVHADNEVPGQTTVIPPIETLDPSLPTGPTEPPTQETTTNSALAPTTSSISIFIATATIFIALFNIY